MLAVHSSFWARKERRWGLLGGGIERGEDPRDAVRRELEEEVELYLSDFEEIGAFNYKGAEHMVYGASTDYLVTEYDDSELLDLAWYSHAEVSSLAAQNKLHAGYELQAIDRYLAQANKTE